MILISNIFFIFLLLPYFSPIPIRISDIQPVAGILAVIIFCLKLVSRDISLSKFGLILFVYSIFSIFYVYVGIEESYTLEEIKKRIGLLYMFLLYFAIREVNSYFKLNVFLIIVAFNLIAYIFHQASPDLFAKSLGLFIREVKIVEFSYRGASGLAPENSFAAFNAVYYIVILFYFWYILRIDIEKYKYGYKPLNLSISPKLLVIGSSLYIIINSKSGIGYLITLILALTAILEYKKLVERVLLILCAIVGLIIFNEFILASEVSFRGVSLLRNLFDDPRNIFSDHSVGHRIINLLVAFFIIINYPFGLGGGSYSYATSKVEHLLYHYYPDPAVVASILYKGAGLVTPIGQYVIEHGLIFIMFYMYVSYLILRSKISFKYTLFLFFVFSTLFFPITHPASAFLMGAIINNKKLINRKRRER